MKQLFGPFPSKGKKHRNTGKRGDNGLRSIIAKKGLLVGRCASFKNTGNNKFGVTAKIQRSKLRVPKRSF